MRERCAELYFHFRVISEANTSDAKKFSSLTVSAAVDALLHISFNVNYRSLRVKIVIRRERHAIKRAIVRDNENHQRSEKRRNGKPFVFQLSRSSETTIPFVLLLTQFCRIRRVTFTSN